MKLNIKSVFRSRIFLVSLVVVVATFILANLAIGLTFKNKTYPNSTVAGVKSGSKSISQLQDLNLIKNSVDIQTSYKKQTVALDKLQVTPDWESTKSGIQQEKSWLPIYDYFRPHQLSLAVNYDADNLNNMSKEVSRDFLQKPVDWTISKADIASLTSGKNGYQVDQATVRDTLVYAITTSGPVVKIEAKEVPPAITKEILEPLVKDLNSKAKLNVSFSYKDKNVQAKSSEILDWFDLDKNKLKISKDSISSFVSSFGTSQGISVKNIDTITNDIVAALQSKTKVSAELIAAPKAVKKYTFCVQAKGVSESLLPEFGDKFLSTLNNPKGWALDGKVSFTKVSSGCNFTAWLTKASLVPSFSSTICDSTWSCSVPPNVIINYDRWTGASPAWNAGGGSLSDYRNMVINHETGHWLDFRHRFCGGKGQLAPVMQQQSINLQGCKFNPWPTQSEKDDLKAKLGI